MVRHGGKKFYISISNGGCELYLWCHSLELRSESSLASLTLHSLNKMNGWCPHGSLTLMNFNPFPLSNPQQEVIAFHFLLHRGIIVVFSGAKKQTSGLRTGKRGQRPSNTGVMRAP